MNQDENNKNQNQNQNKNRLNMPSNFHNYQKMLSNNTLSNFSKKTHSIRHVSQPQSGTVNDDELTQEQLEEQTKQTSSQNKIGIPSIVPKPEPVKGAVEFTKSAAKKKLLIIIAPVTAQIAVAFVGILVLFLIFMTPIARLTEAGENLNSWWANVKNTFTSFCFFCKEDEIAKTEQAKREEKFYKKINKIKNAYLQGKGMDGGDGDDDFSIELDLALLVSSILYNEDLYENSVEAMQDTIDSDSYPSYKQDEFNNLTEEEFDAWRTNNKTYLTDIGLGPNSTFQSVKDELSKTQQEMEEMDISLGWYVAKGDPIGVEWYSEKAAPGAKCYVEEYIYSQDEDPAWASTARKIAKHMVERKINATCTLRSHTDERGNTRYYWEKRVEFDYVLNVEKEQKLYTPEVHANPYPERRTPDELNDPQHPNPYVKYMLSTYIPSKHTNLIKDEELVSTDSYLVSVKNVLSDIYTYRDTYEQWLKYWDEELNNGYYSDFGYFYAECSAVVVNSGDGAGTYNLEDYVARVISAENLRAGPESMKAQAIAVRTYVLSRTNNCKNAIGDSSKTQNIISKNAEPDSRAVEAAKATAGMVLMYNGSIFSTEYDSFYKGGDFSCNDIICSVTYTKRPNGEKHVVSVPADLKNQFAGGHGRGMSQIAANYMGDQGSTYEEILKYFYSDGVVIGNLTGGLLSGKTYSSTAQIHSSVQSIRQSGNYPEDSNLGQCVWYARYRAREIVRNSDMPDDVKAYISNYLVTTARGNGEAWYRIFNDNFEKSTDITQPRPGAIVSWSGGGGKYAGCGHVAIIESVNNDGTVTVSEGWNSTGAHSWSAVSYQVRKYTIEQLRNYGGGGYQFNGYVYLLG